VGGVAVQRVRFRVEHLEASFDGPFGVARIGLVWLEYTAGFALRDVAAGRTDFSFVDEALEMVVDLVHGLIPAVVVEVVLHVPSGLLD
jgi:hypothetical protein